MHSPVVPWPMVSERVKDLFRQGAEQVLSPGPEGYEELHRATLAGLRSQGVVDDPTLVEATQRANAANLRQWAAFNVSNPGERVPPHMGPEAVDIARDLVRRGLDSRALDSYRTSQSVAWRLWMQICFALTDDLDDLRALLEVSALSISTYLDDTIDLVSERIAADFDELTRGTNAERMAMVTLILEGAPIVRARAEARLGYQLTGDHTAAIIWTSPGSDPDRTTAPNVAAKLEATADGLMRLSGAKRRLTLVGSARSLWVWIPTVPTPQTEALSALVADQPDVYVAVGRSGAGLDGFRNSYLDAATTQQMLARVTSHQRVARYEDVQLVTLMTSDLARADEFVADTLGSLADGEPELRETVATYVKELFNASRTAERLYTHRNTVLRRLERADHLMPRPLAENVTNVAAALEMLRFRPAPR